MKLKTFRIWLVLLPAVAIIGVMLFVQSTNNQEELKQQHIRSIASLSKDIQVALPDYLRRVDAMLLRQGYINSSMQPIDSLATLVQELRKSFQPQVSNLRFLEKEELPKVELKLDGATIRIKNQPVLIPPPYDSVFLATVTSKPSFLKPYFPEPNPKSPVLVMDIKIPIRDLFDKLLANDFVFEKFYLTDSHGMVLYPEESMGTSLFKPETLKTDSAGLTHAGISFSQIVLDENQYHLYASPFYLESNRLYFVGLYDSDYFLKIGLRINYNLLSTLLLILILLIASIPILGVVRMGRGDNMTQARIIQVGISLMTIAVVIGFSASFSKNRPVPSRILEKSIATSGETLKNNLTQFDTALDNWIADLKNSFPDSTNELIRVHAGNGYVDEIVYVQDKGINPIPINFNNSTSFISLKERQYIRYFSSKEKKTRFLDSHYSRGTGELETVIASQNPSSPATINAITFSLFLDSIYTFDHHILLIKEDGKVIFKSKKVESSLSNLSESISPDKWKEVSSLLQNNRTAGHAISLQVPLYLNGHQYEAIFRQIDSTQYDSPLWQVFFVNTNAFHAFSGLTSLEGAIFVLTYFVIFLIALFAQWSTRTDSNSKGFKSFLFEWLVPTDKNRPRLNYLMVVYLAYAMVLFGILRSTPLNPLATLALMTFSSLCISSINLGSAQVAEIVKTKKISTELFVLSGFLLFTFLQAGWVFPKLLFGLTALFAVSILIVVVWSRVECKKAEFPWLNYIKSPKHTLSVYLVFWFFLIGFLPGYLLQSKTQQFEWRIWNSELPSNPENELDDATAEFEKVRRGIMSTLTDPFESEVQDFIAPNQHILRAAWEGSSVHLSKNPGAYLWFAILILASYVAIRWIQGSIFFDLRSEKSAPSESVDAPNFICCINSNQIPLSDNKTETIDLKYMTFPDHFVPFAPSYRLINFHCVENPLTLVLPISQIKNSHRRLTIYSGALWKNIYNAIKSERDQNIFSELFSEFKFSVIQIEDVEQNSPKDETEIRARLKRNKAFYANIWTDLCFEEKVVCNSYAKEGFFNPARKNTMLDLAQKGIIVPKTSSVSPDAWIEWRLFSSVFRHYILTHATEEEAASFGAYEKKHGNVRTIQTAVISFVLICIALVGIFDKTFFNDAYTYLTGGLGVLGTVYSFLSQGFAGFGSSKKDG